MFLMNYPIKCQISIVNYQKLLLLLPVGHLSIIIGLLAPEFINQEVNLVTRHCLDDFRIRWFLFFKNLLETRTALSSDGRFAANTFSSIVEASQETTSTIMAALIALASILSLSRNRLETLTRIMLGSWSGPIACRRLGLTRGGCLELWDVDFSSGFANQL